MNNLQKKILPLNFQKVLPSDHNHTTASAALINEQAKEMLYPEQQVVVQAG